MYLFLFILNKNKYICRKYLDCNPNIIINKFGKININHKLNNEKRKVSIEIKKPVCIRQITYWTNENSF